MAVARTIRRRRRWIDERDPSRYIRRSAHLPHLGPEAEHRVELEMEALRRASHRFNPAKGDPPDE